MEVTFQLNLADWKAFLRSVKATPLHNLWRVTLAALLVQLGMALIDRDLPQQFASLGWRGILPQILGVLATLAFFGVVAAYTLWWQEATIKKTPLLVDAITLKIDDEGVTGTTGRGRNTFFWPALHSVIESDTHFFALSGAKTGFIIPKCAFDSPAQCAEFGAFLNRKWAQHRPDSPPIALAK